MIIPMVAAVLLPLFGPFTVGKSCWLIRCRLFAIVRNVRIAMIAMDGLSESSDSAQWVEEDPDVESGEGSLGKRGGA